MNRQHAEHTPAGAAVGAVLGLAGGLGEDAHAHGKFHAQFDRVVSGQQHTAGKLVARLAMLNHLVRNPNGAPASKLRTWVAEIDGLELELRALDRETYHVNDFPNTVLTAGKNFALDSFLAGSSYTAAWYLGLISSVSYSAINAADTAASHAGWLEAGAANAPTYSGNRKTAAWSSASGGSKALSAGLVFTFTGAGTVKGGFLGTTNTVDATTGTWYSAGLFTGGDKVVASSDTLTVSYSASL